MITALPIHQWPSADRDGWQAACVPDQRLERGGRAGKLVPEMQADHARRYGYFLRFLAEQGTLDLSAEATYQITPAAVHTFLAQRTTWSSVTVSTFVARLLGIARFLRPDRDWTWLRELQQDTKSAAIPRSKRDRLVTTGQLVKAGLSVIKEAALRQGASELKRACMARNGFMVALLALCPIRLRNFSSLELGTSFKVEDNQWWIDLDASQTKARRPDNREVPEDLADGLSEYLTRYRLVLLGSAEQQETEPLSALGCLRGPLWISATGKGLSYSGVGLVLTETTRQALGVAVTPHLFRAAAATTAAYLGGRQPNLASGLLQHTDRRTTAEHYNRASSLQAGLDYGRLLRGRGST